MPYYYNVSDVVIFTDSREDSSNDIQEAMQYNCKIVFVYVGNVPENLQMFKFVFYASIRQKTLLQK